MKIPGSDRQGNAGIQWEFSGRDVMVKGKMWFRGICEGGVAESCGEKAADWSG